MFSTWDISKAAESQRLYRINYISNDHMVSPLPPPVYE